jgi:hypothetical protein
MNSRPLHDKIGRRLSWTADLGTNTGVAGLQGAVAQARPITPNRSIERLGAPGVHHVVDGGDPFDIGAEAGLTGKIESR